MKKTIKIMLTLALVIAALCITASAEGTNGFYDIGTAANVAITAYAGTNTTDAITGETVDIDTTDAVAENTYYEGSDRLGVTYSGATANEDYGVILVKGSSLPTASSAIYYINQEKAASNSIAFDVYPATIEETMDMTLYISSSKEGAELVSVPMNYVVGYEEVVEPEEPTFTYGDVDDNGNVENKDKTFLTRYLAGGYTFNFEFNVNAANVKEDYKEDGSPKIDNKDKTFLTRYLAGGYFDPNVLPQ